MESPAWNRIVKPESFVNVDRFLGWFNLSHDVSPQLPRTVHIDLMPRSRGLGMELRTPEKHLAPEGQEFFLQPSELQSYRPQPDG